MKRRTFAAASAVSCVFLLVAAASWIRSYWVYDQVALGVFVHGRWDWTAYSASYPFARWPPPRPKGASLTLLTCFGKLSLYETVHHGDAERGRVGRGDAWASDDNIIPSFSYQYAATGDLSGKGWWTIRQVTMRHWSLVALFALAPTLWLWSAASVRIRRIAVWGDIAFYLGVLGVGLWVAPHTSAWRVGIVVAAIAFPLWIVARLHLGSAFSFKAEARHLVTSGLYSKVRHPVYVFGTVASLSTLLTLQIWPLLALGVALIPITWLRMRREERVLGAAFGEQYERYRERTWF